MVCLLFFSSFSVPLSRVLWGKGVLHLDYSLLWPQTLSQWLAQSSRCWVRESMNEWLSLSFCDCPVIHACVHSIPLISLGLLSTLLLWEETFSYFVFRLCHFIKPSTSKRGRLWRLCYIWWKKPVYSVGKINRPVILWQSRQMLMIPIISGGNTDLKCWPSIQRPQISIYLPKPNFKHSAHKLGN